MRKFGLIGKDLSHSFSPKYFSEKFDRENICASYGLYELSDIEELSRLFARTPDLIGLNVTVPYKVAVMAILTDLTETARSVGAVNTVLLTASGKRIGHNTDVGGFRQSLDSFLPEGAEVEALILGSGGASKAVSAVLRGKGFKHLIVSRDDSRGDLTYADLDGEVMRRHRLLVNCTPLGTFPAVDACPDIPYHFLNEYHWLHDLVYNPAMTAFMKNGLLMGAKVKNGSEMLVAQAELAWEFWNEGDSRTNF